MITVSAQGIPATATETASPAAELKICGKGEVISVISGDRIHLSGNREIILADIKAPELWGNGAPYKSWPYARKATDTLKELALGQQITLYCARQRNALTGQLEAHVVREDGVWLQSKMIESGSAFFYRTLKSNLAPTPLLDAEASARQNRQGLWALSGYKIQKANTDGVKPGWFQLVQGHVLSAKKVRDKVFLNFGEDWSTDFTLEMPATYLKALQLSDSLTSLTGTQIVARGWVEWAGGPKILLENPDNLQIGPAYSR